MSLAPFAIRDFRLFQGIRFLLTLAIQMQSVAVGWHVYDLTRDPLDLGYVGLAQFLPIIGFFPISGHAADRFDRRRVLIFCYLGVIASSVLLSWTTYAGIRDVRVIYAILVLFGITRAFSGPAGVALVTNIVPMEHYPKAVAWSSTIWQTAAIVGPSVGGLVYGLGGAKLVFNVSAALGLVSLSLLLSMRVRTGRMEKTATSLETLSAGLRYVWSQRLILGSITLDLFAVLLGGAVALLPIYARDVLHTGPWGLGLLRSAPAIGAAATAAWIAFHPIQRRAGATMFVCVGIFGVATTVFALSSWYWLSLVALVIAGASDMVSVVVRATLVQVTTPIEKRGRVAAVNQVFIGASNELGEFESGLTAAWLGPVRAGAIGGLATVLVVIACAFLFPSLRKVDRIDQPPPTA